MTRLVVCDTETTGIGHRSGHRMVSIGLCELIDNRRTGHQMEWFANPFRPCEPGAYAAHGLSDEFLATCWPFERHHKEVEEFIGGDQLVAHNAAFDMGFVNAEFWRIERTETPKYPKERWIDTLPMARKRYPGQKNSLDALADRFKIDRSHRKFHGALKDAVILAQVYVEMIMSELTLLDVTVQQRRLPDASEPLVRKTPPSRLTPAEIERHTAHMAEIGGKDAPPIWGDYMNLTPTESGRSRKG